VFHPLISALKASALLNIPSMCVTAAVFHALILALKDVWYENRYIMFVISETFQVLISPQATPPQMLLFAA
jgi:hypothetical protein